MKYLSNKNGFLGIDNKFNFKENVGSQLNEKGVVDVQLNLDTLVDFQRVSSKDTIKNLTSGMVSSKLITHDVYNKRVDLYKYDYLDNFDRDIHPDNGEATPIISTAKDPDTNKSLTDSDCVSDRQCPTVVPPG